MAWAVILHWSDGGGDVDRGDDKRGEGMVEGRIDGIHFSGVDVSGGGGGKPVGEGAGALQDADWAAAKRAGSLSVGQLRRRLGK